jgi:hypothetical protein
MTGGARTQLKKEGLLEPTLPQRGIGFVVWDRLEKGASRGGRVRIGDSEER